MLPDTPASARSWRLLFSAWLVAMAATLGSLFFSEVMELVPCVLCWYQRIFMFPLAVVLLAAPVAPANSTLPPTRFTS